jgi:hypothetical protein
MPVYKTNSFDIIIVDEHDNEIQPEDYKKGFSDNLVDAYNGIVKVYNNAICPLHPESGIETIFFIEPSVFEIRMTCCCVVRQALLETLFQTDEPNLRYKFYSLIAPENSTEDGAELKKYIDQLIHEKLDISSNLDGISYSTNDELDDDSNHD